LGRRATTTADSLAGARLVWWAFVGLILPGLLWIAAVWQFSRSLGELAACSVGLLAWLLLLVVVRAMMTVPKWRILRTARQRWNAQRAGMR
jgi:glucan phosphoethanolaminetransferase (alkaline phosphatase superfamily)